jgi:hypothetical protein
MTKTWSLGKIVRVIVLAFFVLALPRQFYGQATGLTEGISGVVEDPSGAAIPGATVVARSVATGVKTTAITSSAGFFSFQGLLVGAYSVTVSARGFRTFSKQDVRVLAGVTPNLDIRLELGATTQSVTVHGGAPLLDTTSTTQGETRSGQELTEFPVEVSGGYQTLRQPLAYLNTMGAVSDTTYGNGSYSLVNGTGDSGGWGTVTSYNVDGIFQATQAVNSFGDTGPSPDMVQEVRLSTDNTADEGWNLGSSFDVVLKSGTNAFHGDAYEYMRNTALDARNFFSATRGVDMQNEFGGIVGGPIKKDKDFFIVNWRGFREVVTNPGQIITVPTIAERNGDFGQLLGPQIGTDVLGRPVYSGEIYNPATTRPDGNGGFIRDPFPGNIIPQSDLSHISTYFANQFPAPNLPGVQNNFNGTPIGGGYGASQVLVKDDFDFGSQRFSPSYELYRAGPTQCSGVAYVGYGPAINGCTFSTDRLQRIRLSYTWMAKPNLVVAVHAGLNYVRENMDSFSGTLDAGAQAGLTGVYGAGTPSVQINGFLAGKAFETEPDDEGASSTLFETVPIDVDANWIDGRHQVKFGAQTMFQVVDLLSEANEDGTFYFQPEETALPDWTGTTSLLPPGWGLASYMLGDVDSASVQSPFDQKYTNSMWAWYAQDQFRVSSRLTINYGLRYDLQLTSHEQYDRISDLCLTCPNSAAGGLPGALTFWGNGPGRNGRSLLFNTYPWDFGPRLGIAYKLSPKMVARAYAGITYYPFSGDMTYYDPGIPNDGWGADLSESSTNNGVTPTFQWDKGTFTLPKLPDLSPTLANGSGIPYFNPTDDKPAEGTNLGFTLERTLRWGLVARARYASTLVHGLPTNNLVALNELPLDAPQKYGELLFDNVDSAQAQAAGIPIPYPGFTGTVAQALRPFPQYGDIEDVSAQDKNTYYNGGIFELQRHFGRGFTFLAAYTISKELTNDPFYTCVSSVCGLSLVSVQQTSLREKTGTAQPIGALLGEGGDRAQSLKLSYVYDLPFGHGQRFLTKANPTIDRLVGGWKASVFQTYVSGAPFPLSAASNIGPGAALPTASVPTWGPAWANQVPGQPERTNVSCSDYEPNNPSTDLYLNPKAFANPPLLTLGTTYVLPNVRTCGLMDEDLSLSKDTPITERVHLNISVNAFNVFNRVSWYNLNTSVGQPAFGQYSAANDPRVIQLHAEVTF